MARYDDLNTGTIAYAAFVSTVLLLIIVLLVRALCYYWVEAEDTKKLAEAHYHSADEIIGEQIAKISQFAKVPEAAAGEGGTGESVKFQIPVEKAKTLLLNELSAQQAPSS